MTAQEVAVSGSSAPGVSYRGAVLRARIQQLVKHLATRVVELDDGLPLLRVLRESTQLTRVPHDPREVQGVSVRVQDASRPIPEHSFPIGGVPDVIDPLVSILEIHARSIRSNTVESPQVLQLIVNDVGIARRMDPPTSFPFDGQVTPEIGYRWKRARMRGKVAAHRVRHAGATPSWPPRPSSIELHSIDQVHGDSDEHILLKPIGGRRLGFVLATQRDEPVRQFVMIPVDEGQTAVGRVLAKTVAGIKRELRLAERGLVREAIEEGYDAC